MQLAIERSAATSSDLWLPLFVQMAVAVTGLVAISLGAAEHFGHGAVIAAPSQDLAIGILWSVFLGVTLRFWPLPVDDRRILLWLWTARSIVRLGLMLPYEDHYADQLDAFGFFRGSELLDMSIFDLGPGRGTEAVLLLTSMFRWVLFDSYHATKLTYAYLGLVAICLHYLAVCVWLGERRTGTLWLLGLFPSAIFWSSILGKNPLCLLGIGLFLFGYLKYFIDSSRRGLVACAAGLVLLGFIRVWLTLILLVPAGAIQLLSRGNAVQRVVTLIIFGAACFVAFDYFASTFGVESSADVVDQAHFWSRAWESGGSAGAVADFSSFGDILGFAPIGAFTALFRPLPGEVSGAFGLMAGLEGLLLLMMTLYAVARLKRQVLRSPVAWLLFSMVGLWAFVYGPISSQNLGTAVRFRLQVLPTLLILVSTVHRRALAAKLRDRGVPVR